MGNVLQQPATDRAHSVTGRVSVTPQRRKNSKYHQRKRQHVGAHYEIVEELWRGAFSYLLRVRHMESGACLVCKTVTKQVISSAARKTSNSMHVHREADIMEHLSGPLTAELVELYEDDAMYHFIIALPPDGKPLDQALLTLPNTEAMAADLIRMAARCVNHCHQRGVIHRGISPSAFMWRPLGGLPDQATGFAALGTGSTAAAEATVGAALAARSTGAARLPAGAAGGGMVSGAAAVAEATGDAMGKVGGAAGAGAEASGSELLSMPSPRMVEDTAAAVPASSLPAAEPPAAAASVATMPASRVSPASAANVSAAAVPAAGQAVAAHAAEGATGAMNPTQCLVQAVAPGQALMNGTAASGHGRGDAASAAAPVASVDAAAERTSATGAGGAAAHSGRDRPAENVTPRSVLPSLLSTNGRGVAAAVASGGLASRSSAGAGAGRTSGGVSNGRSSAGALAGRASGGATSRRMSGAGAASGRMNGAGAGSGRMNGGGAGSGRMSGGGGGASAADEDRRQSASAASTSGASAGWYLNGRGGRPSAATVLLSRLCGGGGGGGRSMRRLRSMASRNDRSASYTHRGVEPSYESGGSLVTRLSSTGGGGSVRGPQALQLFEFEQARFVTNKNKFSSLRGSYLHAAPEMVRKYKAPSDPAVPTYGPEVDVWALGVLLYALLSGRMPFVEDTMEDTLASILNDPLDLTSEPWPHISEQACNLVAAMLDKNPRTRITARQVLQHPFMSEAHLFTRPCYEGPRELWSARQALQLCMREARRFSATVVDLTEARELLTAAQRLQRIGGSTVAKAERVLAEVLSGGNRGGGSGGKVRGSARHSQLQGLHQILNALEVETDCLNDLIEFLTAMLQLSTSSHDDLLCKILCNLPGPSKSSASGRVSPRDIIRILSICHSGPQTSSGKLPAVPHSKLPAASASAAERLASPGELGKGGGSSVQPLAFGSPSKRPASGSVPAVEVDAQPVWAPPGVVTQPAIPGGPKA